MFFRIKKSGERGYLQVVQQTSRCRGDRCGSFSALKTASPFSGQFEKPHGAGASRAGIMPSVCRLGDTN